MGNSCIRYWMDNPKVGRYDLNKWRSNSRAMALFIRKISHV
ncbi:MAG: hypothetical protein WBB29_10300 [Geitlerinemataceae cyanobacterium]